MFRVKKKKIPLHKRTHTNSGLLKPIYSRAIYHDYMASSDYTKIRSELKKNACELCGSKFRLTFHHMDYKYLTKENEDVVATLCWDCHQTCHIEIQFSKGKTRKLVKPSRVISNLIKRVRYGNKIKGHTTYFQRLVYIQKGILVQAKPHILRQHTNYDSVLSMWRH